MMVGLATNQQEIDRANSTLVRSRDSSPKSLRSCNNSSAQQLFSVIPEDIKEALLKVRGVNGDYSL